MQDRFLTRRVEVLENTLLGPDGVVEQLGFIRAELKDMRQETRAEFAAVRQELTVGLTDVQQRIAQVDTHMRLLHEDAISRIANSRPTRRRTKR